MTFAHTRRRRAGGERRQAVLKNVIEVLAERGYYNTRFRDVSDASGVAISTLQGYFGSREDMLVEALQAATEGEVTEMRRVSEGIEDLWQQVVLLVDRGIDTPTPVWRMLMEFWTAAAHDDELRADSIGLQARYREPFETTLQLGVDTGVFHPKHDMDRSLTWWSPPSMDSVFRGCCNSRTRSSKAFGLFCSISSQRR